MTEDEKWIAVINNDRTCDGRFFYAVKTTGIYCRPSCTSKRSKRENTLFFDSAAEAVSAGFRPCKRCRPDLISYEPQKDLAERARLIIEEQYHDTELMSSSFRNLGISSHRLGEIFSRQYGKSIREYITVVRITEAMRLLTGTDQKIVDVAYQVGFNSISAFYSTFRRYTSTTPALFRKQKGVQTL